MGLLFLKNIYFMVFLQIKLTFWIIVHKWASKKLPTSYFFPFLSPPMWLVHCNLLMLLFLSFIIADYKSFTLFIVSRLSSFLHSFSSCSSPFFSFFFLFFLFFFHKSKSKILPLIGLKEYFKYSLIKFILRKL